MKIKSIKGREILDSRGNPTVRRFLRELLRASTKPWNCVTEIKNVTEVKAC